MYIKKDFLQLKLDELVELNHFQLCYVERCSQLDIRDKDEERTHQGLRLFFTNADLTKQWGDDWNDAPYDCNAGWPYDDTSTQDEDGKWRKPDAEKAADLEILRGKKLMKEFNLYLEQASKPKAKRMKDTRLEVLRYGFKECYKQKNYQAIVTVGDHIQESLLQEDEVLLQYYDIASMRV